MGAFRYRIVTEWSDEDEAFVARVPAFPGCAAHGSTSATAAKEAQSAAEAMLEVMSKRRIARPPEDATASYSGQIRLRMPRSLHERLARMATAEGVSLNQLMLTLLAQGAGAQISAEPCAEKRGRRAAAK
jgi:antitoxin HicB